eukprot:g7265.t1
MWYSLDLAAAMPVLAYFAKKMRHLVLAEQERKEAEQEAVVLKKKNKKIEDNVTLSQAAQEKAEKEITEHNDRVGQLQTQNAYLASRIDGQEEEKASLKVEIKKVADKASELSGENTRLRDEIDSFDEKAGNRTQRKVLPKLLAKMVGPLASDATPRTPRAWRDGAGALSAEERLARPKSCPVLKSKRPSTIVTRMLGGGNGLERTGTAATSRSPSAPTRPKRVVSMERLKALAEPKRKKPWKACAVPPLEAEAPEAEATAPGGEAEKPKETKETKPKPKAKPKSQPRTSLKALANAERAAKAKLEAAEAMLCCTCEAHEDTCKEDRFDQAFKTIGERPCTGTSESQFAVAHLGALGEDGEVRRVFTDGEGDPEETETALQLGTAETGLQAATTVNDTEAFKKELEYIKREDVLDEAGRQRPILIQSTESDLLEKLQVNEFLYEAQQARNPVPPMIEKIAQLLAMLHEGQQRADAYLGASDGPKTSGEANHNAGWTGGVHFFVDAF